jgi:hypothetical protein
MFNWKMILLMVLPMMEAAGQAKIEEDANSTGKDDITGEAILYAVKLVKAIVMGKSDLPKAPKALH